MNQSIIKALFGAAMIAVMMLSSTFLSAAESSLARPKVAWAGLSLAGDASKLKLLYPKVYPLQDRANRLLRKQIQNQNYQHYQLVVNDKIDISKGHSLVMTVAMDSESVVVRELAGVHQAVVELSASILVFDIDSEEKSVIASFPVGLGPYIETYSKPPSQGQLATLVEGYLFGGLSGMPAGLVETAASKMQSLDIKYRFAAKIGIGNIELGDGAKKVMASHFAKDEPLMKQYVARQTARLLSNQQQVSVMPYVADNTVAQMALRFTGQKSTLLLSLPEPDYTIHVNVQNLARKLIQENKHEKMYIYAARATVQVQDDFEDALFGQSIKGYVRKTVLTSQPSISQWAVYQGALENLTSQFLSQINEPDPAWFAFNGFEEQEEAQIKASLQAVAEALEQCR